MSGSKQHARDGNNAFVAAFAQGIKAFANYRRGEFQKAAVHIVLGQAIADAVGDTLKFSDRVYIPAAMAADHDANACRVRICRVSVCHVTLLHSVRRACSMPCNAANLLPSRLSTAVCMFEFVFPVLTENGWAQGLQAVLLAFVLDLLFGEPKWLYRHMPHPIVWIGGLIEGLEAGLLKDDQSPAGQIFKGGALVVIVVGLCAVAGMILAWVAAFSGYGWIITGVIGSTLIAARSLHDHVIAVGVGLTENLADGRRAVSHIVGRDPKNLDEAGVSRAALESLAENFSDGVVAPLFWFLVAGLPGLLAYKAINTLDSMVGHRNTRYLYFGRIAARLDDVVNWPAARITGLLFCLCALLSPGSRGREAWAVMWHEHGKHASPNAGWPEGAMAGALGIGLAGPRIYQGKIVDGAWLGAGEAGVEDISRGCRLYCWTCGLVVLVLLAGILV